MPTLARTVAAVAAAAALAVAAPVAANAATHGSYPPSQQTGWSSTVCAGGTLTHVLPAGTFGDSRALTESVTGASSAVPTPAMFLAAAATYSLNSTSMGGATVKLTFPANASGTYDVSVMQQGGTAAAVGAVRVATPGTMGCADPVSAATTTTTPLAVTGTDINVGILWSAVGAVGFGGFLSIVLARRRRTRQH